MCYTKIMKRFFSYVLSFSIICLLCFNLVGCFREEIIDPINPSTPITPPDTPTVETSINYVSLGDSIPAGFGLDGFNPDEYTFVNSSYTYLFKTMLEEEYDVVNAVTYAHSGDTSGNLLSLLTPLLSDELTEDNQTMKTNIQQADIITICIGANDILGPATDNLIDYIKGTIDITEYLDTGLQNLSNNFSTLVSTLQTLNPTCKLVFSSVYNPYKEFIDTTKSVSISMGYFPLTLGAEKLNEIGSIAEVYIDSGSVDITVSGQQSTKTISAGVNQIILDNITIDEENTVFKENCYLLDVKSCFDNYYDSKTENKYDIINCYLLSSSTAINFNEITTAIDPHPNTAGHELIFNLLNNWYNTNIEQ